MTYAPFLWAGDGPFVRVVVWRGRWQLAPASWAIQAWMADQAQASFLRGGA